MRIISGEFKGKKLRIPHINGVRPTYDKVREALFDIIGNRCEGLSFLDLFAGCGSVGLEALSRGAEKVVFVENDRRAVGVLNYNLSLFPSIEKSRTSIIYADIKKAFSILNRDHMKFDIIFSDPPYLKEDLNKIVLEQSVEQGLINSDGVIVLEKSCRTKLSYATNLYKLLEKNYGETVLVFYGCYEETRFLSYKTKKASVLDQKLKG